MRFLRKKSGNSDSHWLRISILFLVCTLIYYLPAIIGLGGGILDKSTLNSLHNFYGLDFFAVLFFLPVVYAAYTIGVLRAVVVALASAMVFLPYSIFITNQPGTLFRPTAFVLILSTVAAVIAILQKSDEQRRRSMSELICLYEIGKSTEKISSVEQFLEAATRLIPQNLNTKRSVQVSITLRGKTYTDNYGYSFSRQISEPIIVAGEAAGSLDIAYPSAYPWDKNLDHFIKTLAERIGGAIHGIELEQSLKLYYEQLEQAVEARTRELEQTQEKLIRTERLAAVGELASGVGHELRNPLNVIRNCVYLINMNLEDKPNPEIEDTLKMLDVQVDISNKIVSDLLDYTRVKKPMRNTVNLNNMIKDRVSWATVPEKISIKLDLSAEDPQLYVDAEQVGRAFTNIINNAVQSISNSGEVMVSTGVEENQAWIKFADSGCGIPAENLGRIFDPLFTTKSKGIGLGLAITKRMVEQNHGEIAVESTVGRGTTFTVKLPLIIKEALQNEATGEHTRC